MRVPFPWGYRARSGVEPCFLTACKVRSFELALLLGFGLSTASGIAPSEECSLCEDLEAIKLEKKPLDASRPCLGDRGGAGEGGNSGMAVIRGEVGAIWWESSRSSTAEMWCIMDGERLPCRYGEEGAEPGERGDPAERGLSVAGVKPLNSPLFLEAFKLRYGRAEALGISAAVEQCHPQADCREPAGLRV